MLNDPGNRAIAVPPTRDCGCPIEGHEPFCDIGRLARDYAVADLIAAVRVWKRSRWGNRFDDKEQLVVNALTEFDKNLSMDA